ncbi:uncharacterized protein [Heterodontus francisci]|uniref:uncharacterized protein n=1 Tax=Heterodontus francisci TaxID=7792 RepID=UPI00355C367B
MSTTDNAIESLPQHRVLHELALDPSQTEIIKALKQLSVGFRRNQDGVIKSLHCGKRLEVHYVKEADDLTMELEQPQLAEFPRPRDAQREGLDLGESSFCEGLARFIGILLTFARRLKKCSVLRLKVPPWDPGTSLKRETARESFLLFGLQSAVCYLSVWHNSNSPQFGQQIQRLSSKYRRSKGHLHAKTLQRITLLQLRLRIWNISYEKPAGRRVEKGMI